MGDIELDRTENIQIYDFKCRGREVGGVITNQGQNGSDFVCKTDGFPEEFSSEDLRAIASKLDELNGRIKDG